MYAANSDQANKDTNLHRSIEAAAKLKNKLTELFVHNGLILLQVARQNLKTLA